MNFNTGLEFADLQSVINSSPWTELKQKFPELTKSDPEKVLAANEFSEVCEKLRSLNPGSLNELVSLYKVCSVAFLLKCDSDDCVDEDGSRGKRYDCLHYAFGLKVGDWDIDPEVLHLVASELFGVVKPGKNLLTLIHGIDTCSSRIGQNVSLCLLWALTFAAAGKTIQTFKLFTLSDLLDVLDESDLSDMAKDLKTFQIFLESMAYLVNVIVTQSVDGVTMEKFDDCFRYNQDEVLALRNYATRASRLFTIRGSDECIEKMNLKIANIIEFDILSCLDNALRADYADSSGFPNDSISR